MIDPNKCQVCYPIVAKIFEIKFEGEKEVRKCVLRSWKECDRPSVEHIKSYVDPRNLNTEFTMHRCVEHVEEARLLHETFEKAKQQENK